jgi:hypothetical protein
MATVDPGMPSADRSPRQSDEIRFGGPGDLDPHDGGTDQPDPQRGATLEQAWNVSFQIFGIPFVCLLATDGPRVVTEKIPRVIRLDPDELVAGVARVLGDVPHASSQAFTYDGRIGHSITLIGANAQAGTVTFHDPWPGDSLLARHENAAGVDARPTADGRAWEIARNDLARVLVAAFVWPRLWAEVTGRPAGTAYGAVQSSDFWSWFHITEGRREPQSHQTRVELLPGAFREHLELSVTLSARQLVDTADLWIRRSWALDPSTGANPLALDLVSSFIQAFTPPADQDAVASVVDTLRQARDPALTEPRLADPNFVDSPAGRVLLAYVDEERSTFVPMELSGLEINTRQRDGQTWLHIQMRQF